MKLYNCVENCAKHVNAMDLSLLKICVCSAGVIAGLLVPGKSKTHALSAASLVFSLTLIPLMLKTVKVITHHEK